MTYIFYTVFVLFVFVLNSCTNNSKTDEPDLKIFYSKKNAATKIFNVKDSSFFTKLFSYTDNKRIIGLGESTHGSHEFCSFKNSIIKKMVATYDYNYLVIEDDWILANEVNSYISGKLNHNSTSDLERTCSKERLDLFSWLKLNNKKVTVLGFGVADVTDRSYHTVASFLSANDRSFYRDFQWYESLDRQFILNHIIKRYKHYLINTDAQSVNFIIGCAIVSANLERLHSLPIFSPEFNYVRDSVAGVILSFYINHSDTKNKFIIDGHNAHISKRPGALGYYLASISGESYYNVSLVFNKGCYTTWSLGKVNVNCVNVAKKGSVEYELAKLGPKDFFVETSDASSLINGSKIEQRYIGLKGTEVYSFVVPQVEFNSCIYIDSITPLSYPTNSYYFYH